MHGICIRCRMNRDSIDAHFTTGTMNSQRNFTAAGDQDLFKHCLVRSLFDDDQDFTEFNRRAVACQNL